MKTFLWLVLALSTPLSAKAQTQAPALAAPTALAASKTVFLTDFKEPRGLALGYKDGILVADYGAGEIVEFNADGSNRHVYANGLQGPSDVANDGGVTKLISETLNSRVLRLDTMILPVGDELAAPTALVARSEGELRFRPSYYVASATTGKIYQLVPLAKAAAEKSTIYNQYNWKLIYEMPAVDGVTPQIRDITFDGDSLLVSDSSGRVQLRTSTGRMITLVQGIESPTGIATGADKNLYVCDDSGGGRLWKVDPDGIRTLVIGDLGQPYDIVFTDDATALVSDKRGTIWKIALAGAPTVLARNDKDKSG